MLRSHTYEMKWFAMGKHLLAAFLPAVAQGTGVQQLQTQP